MNFTEFDKRIRKLNTRFLLSFNIFICIILGYAGWYIGNEFSFSIFYLIPVLIVAWYTNRKSGIFISFFAAFTWLIGDLFAGRSYSVSFIPYINAAARAVLFLSFSTLVLAVRKNLYSETKSANEDFLTKISNSRAFFNYTAMEIKRLSRYKKPFTLVYFDVDNFKAINDNYGHNAGDELLVTLARAIRRNIRPTDVVARLGGDEFAVLLIETGPQQARKVLPKLQTKMKEALEQTEISVTFSFGVVTFLKSPISIDDMIKKADDMMYLAKRKGKDMINYFVYR
ncbi:MAG: GGDEF domain-containing protein [Spirochaetia bacterium]|nr:GGDEF domain-containing protein [Spirochaetia bacterium]